MNARIGIPVLRTTVWSGMKALTAPHCQPDHFGAKPFRPGTPQPKSFVFTGVPWTAFSGNDFYFGTSIEVKRTLSEYHNQKRVLHSAREYQN